VYEIARDQLLQQRLREELGKLQGCPEESSVRQLPLLDAVFNETLRMHPPVSVLHHVAAQTVIVPTSTSQIVVPGGTVIAIPVDAVHRDEAVWGGDCNEFWPERWLGKSQRSEALLSFSQG
jgi:cytochrome P450